MYIIIFNYDQRNYSSREEAKEAAELIVKDDNWYANYMILEQSNRG